MRLSRKNEGKQISIGSGRARRGQRIEFILGGNKNNEDMVIVPLDHDNILFLRGLNFSRALVHRLYLYLFIFFLADRGLRFNADCHEVYAGPSFLSSFQERRIVCARCLKCPLNDSCTLTHPRAYVVGYASLDDGWHRLILAIPTCCVLRRGEHVFHPDEDEQCAFRRQFGQM